MDLVVVVYKYIEIVEVVAEDSMDLVAVDYMCS
jgi:hypothetical protein